MPKRTYTAEEVRGSKLYKSLHKPKRQRTNGKPAYSRGQYKQSIAKERKFFDTDVADASVASTLSKTNLNIVPEGVGESERIGRKIIIEAIQVKGDVAITASTTAAGSRVRLMLVYDKQTNIAAFGSTVLLTTDAINSYNNLNNRKRFKVLWTETIDLSVNGGAASGAAFVMGTQKRSFELYKKVRIEIEYDAGAQTGAVTTQTSGSVWFCQISDNNNVPTLTGTARIRYCD